MTINIQKAIKLIIHLDIEYLSLSFSKMIIKLVRSILFLQMMTHKLLESQRIN